MAQKRKSGKNAPRGDICEFCPYKSGAFWPILSKYAILKV